MSRVRSLFSFPDPVNELAARVVAGIVVLLCACAIAFREPWLLIPLTYGFWARMLTGPSLSLGGQIATRVVAPRLGPPRLVAGPPKRFAQAIGVAFSTTALVLWFGFSAHLATWIIVAILGAAASLESVAGFCLGCRAFALLMKAGLIPKEVCRACADLSLRYPELKQRAPN